MALATAAVMTPTPAPAHQPTLPPMVAPTNPSSFFMRPQDSGPNLGLPHAPARPRIGLRYPPRGLGPINGRRHIPIAQRQGSTGAPHHDAPVGHSESELQLGPAAQPLLPGGLI